MRFGLAGGVDRKPHIHPAQFRRVEANLEFFGATLRTGGDFHRQAVHIRRGVLRRDMHMLVATLGIGAADGWPPAAAAAVTPARLALARLAPAGLARAARRTGAGTGVAVLASGCGAHPPWTDRWPPLATLPSAMAGGFQRCLQPAAIGACRLDAGGSTARRHRRRRRPELAASPVGRVRAALAVAPTRRGIAWRLRWSCAWCRLPGLAAAALHLRGCLRGRHRPVLTCEAARRRVLLRRQHRLRLDVCGGCACGGCLRGLQRLDWSPAAAIVAAVLASANLSSQRRHVGVIAWFVIIVAWERLRPAAQRLRRRRGASRQACVSDCFVCLVAGLSLAVVGGADPCGRRWRVLSVFCAGRSRWRAALLLSELAI